MNKRRIVTVVLGISLFLNLLAGGFLIGGIVTKTKHEPRMDPSYGFPRLLHVLPRERIRELSPEIRESRKMLRSNYEGVIRAQRQMYRALQAEPFDENEFRKASADYSAEMAKTRETTDHIFASFIGRLTVEERKKVVGAAIRRTERNKYSRQERSQARERSETE